jgi:hypothetical protein
MKLLALSMPVEEFFGPALSDPEGFRGVVTSVLAIGSLVAAIVVWATVQTRREIRNWHHAIVAGVKEEVQINLRVLAANITHLQTELALLEEQEEVLGALQPLQTSTCRLMTFTSHRGTRKNARLALQIGRLVHPAECLNENLRARECFRILAFGTAAYADRLKLYDAMLIEQQQSLLANLQRATAGLMPQPLPLHAHTRGASSTSPGRPPAAAHR